MSRPVRFCTCGDHAFAALTRGYMTMVSPEDAHLLEIPMHARIGGKNYAYAATSPARKSGGYLHRLILRPRADQHVDHISGDKMDNRRCNLRLCTPAENQQNMRHRRNRELPKGVTKDRGGFRAQIKLSDKKINLGRYRTPEEAHEVYVAVAREHFGEFARAA